MSTFSLSSSRSIIAVLWASSTAFRSSVNPVLTFQLAIRRVGVFVSFLLYFPGAGFNDLLVELMSFKLQAPSEAGGSRRVSTLLAGGCPAYGGR